MVNTKSTMPPKHVRSVTRSCGSTMRLAQRLRDPDTSQRPLSIPRSKVESFTGHSKRPANWPIRIPGKWRQQPAAEDRLLTHTSTREKTRSSASSYELSRPVLNPRVVGSIPGRSRGNPARGVPHEQRLRPVLDVALVSGGRTLMTGCANGNAQLWDSASGPTTPTCRSASAASSLAI